MMIELQYIIETSKIINKLKESFEQKNQGISLNGE